MANTRELRRRIKSIKSTAQITKAMQMVAATKMRRAQNQALAGRPYLEALHSSLSHLIKEVKELNSPLLQPSSAPSTGILLLSTDKSLCGALNANLIRFAINFERQTQNPIYYSIGKKGRNFVVKTGKSLSADFENEDLVAFAKAATIARMFITSFLKGELGEVYIIYPHFVSTLTQEPRAIKILPISEVEVVESQETFAPEFLLEPKPADLLDYLLNHFIQTQLYQTMVETKASEHSARMIAMQNATDNAKDLVSDLQLAYNQTRQAAITNQLLEITSAVAALE